MRKIFVDFENKKVSYPIIEDMYDDWDKFGNFEALIGKLLQAFLQSTKNLKNVTVDVFSALVTVKGLFWGHMLVIFLCFHSNSRIIEQ